MQTDRVLEILKAEIRESIANYTKDLILAADYPATIKLQERVKSLQFALDLVDHAYKKAIQD